LSSLTKPSRMKRIVTALLLVTIAMVFSAGCIQSPATGPAVPLASTAPSEQPGQPAPATTAAISVEETRPAITIVHYVPAVKTMKDSELLLTLQVPEDWALSTRRLVNPDDSEGLVYQTDLLKNDTFFIQTYTISRNQDQAYRDRFRKIWVPKPVETTVAINGITYDRFESSSGNTTHVAYIVQKSSANERGYASVLVYAADTGNRFEKEDFEKIIASFRYFPGDEAGTMPGQEIPRTG